MAKEYEVRYCREVADGIESYPDKPLGGDFDFVGLYEREVAEPDEEAVIPEARHFDIDLGVVELLEDGRTSRDHNVKENTRASGR